MLRKSAGIFPENPITSNKSIKISPSGMIQKIICVLHLITELTVSGSCLVREAGVEPARSFPRQILSLVRLPFRHSRNI
jgi:hypothetical protein